MLGYAAPLPAHGLRMIQTVEAVCYKYRNEHLHGRITCWAQLQPCIPLMCAVPLGPPSFDVQDAEGIERVVAGATCTLCPTSQGCQAHEAYASCSIAMGPGAHIGTSSEYGPVMSCDSACGWGRVKGMGTDHGEPRVHHHRVPFTIAHGYPWRVVCMVCTNVGSRVKETITFLANQCVK